MSIMTQHTIQFVQQYTPILSTATGEQYVARAYTDRQPGGLWEAWLVFFSLTTGAVLATDRETTQGKLEYILYWASGLSPTYLLGALERALDLRPEAQLAAGRTRPEPGDPCPAGGRGLRRGRRERHSRRGGGPSSRGLRSARRPVTSRRFEREREPPSGLPMARAGRPSSGRPPLASTWRSSTPSGPFCSARSVSSSARAFAGVRRSSSS